MPSSTYISSLISDAVVMDESGEFTDQDVVIRTYEEAGVMTNEAGFLLQLGDGSEFQVTVVQSRAATN